MKVGMRTPNLKKSFKARTTGKAKRAAMRAINPAYGKKGTGMITNPKKAMYNKVYNKTTFSATNVLSASKRTHTTKAATTSTPYIAPNTEKTKAKDKSNVPLIILIICTILCFIGGNIPLGIILAIVSVILIIKRKNVKKQDPAFINKANETISGNGPDSKVNLSGEDLTKLDPDGNLPFGWVSYNKDFTNKLSDTESYCHNLYHNADSIQQKRDAIKSLLQFVIDAEAYSKKCGECYERYFHDMYTENPNFLNLLNKRKEELEYIEKNYDKLLQKESKRKTLKNDVIRIIRENPGILQKDLYQEFDSDFKPDISNMLYTMDKDQEIKREKSGNTYKVYAN